METRIHSEGITFDDVLLVPRRSDVLPADADTSTNLTRTIKINIPLLSAPMDTVTESALAIALAQEGGIGIIHRNMAIEAQAREVHKVKRSENGVITDPITLSPDQSVSDALALMAENNVSGFPVTADGSGHGKVVGILTRRDLKFLETPSAKVADVMTSEHLITAQSDTTLEQANEILSKGKVEKLLLVNSDGGLFGLITIRDIDNLSQHPQACKDERGRLRVGAAVGVNQIERVAALVAVEVDVIVVDTAHGHSSNVLNSVRDIKSQFPDLQVIAGNIATTEAAQDLIEAGVDAVKVGIGPGSICTTRVVTGVGVPQVTAIHNASVAADPAGVPVIADGGIRSSGDISKAIAAGASAVMMGSMFGGLDESPGEVVIRRGRRFKTYRGMGSVGAMSGGSADRYGQSSDAPPSKFVPEGVEGLVPYRGQLADVVYQMVGGVRASMGYCGCRTIAAMRTEPKFVRITNAGVLESHAHDITITREAPNYSVEMQRSGADAQN
ncbi:MAG: IMP dehydrogenase [Planctomycetes bacterium]|nr:IMP dehydrogenase [Planctomycetota bacterium]NOG53951.1 IMP dehydrogenase [Planctomycetota bacterium]